MTHCTTCNTGKLGAVVDCLYYVEFSSLERMGDHDPLAAPEYAVVRMICDGCGETTTATAEEAEIALSQMP